MDGQTRNGTDRALVLWAVLWFAGLILVVWGNVFLYRYAQVQRERDPWTYLNEADRLMKLGDFPGALEQAEEAIRRGPENPACYRIKGDVYFSFEMWAEALKAYNQALQKGGMSLGVRANALWAYIELKQYATAIAFGNDCLASGVANLAIYRNLAEAHLRSGLLEEAAPHLEKALQARPFDFYLLTNLERAYRAAGKVEKAESMRQRIGRIQIERLPVGIDEEAE